MKIQLVKEVKYDKSSYYVTINGEFKTGSICDSLAEAINMFESVKFEISGKRVEILMQEDI